MGLAKGYGAVSEWCEWGGGGEEACKVRHDQDREVTFGGW